MFRWFQTIRLIQKFRWFQMIHQTLKSQKTPTFLKNHLTQMFQKILMSR
jgi:hypothetical protein